MHTTEKFQELGRKTKVDLKGEECTLKKIIYKSHYRATKEGDFLLSPFAKLILGNCSVAEQANYESLLEYTDAQIQKWVLEPQYAPLPLQSIISKIAKFHHL
jgi:succinate dehydrogenase flavin-adding protein (antitoxin of CptAB toxin-antitoxin module)